MEDAAALGVVLERGSRSEEVLDRLALYQQIRKGRADRLQQYTRLAGEDLRPGETAKLNMMEFVGYNFGHDEHDNSSQKLREWKWSRQPPVHSTTPVAFGPMPGLQSHTSRPADARQPTFVTASIKIKTSRTVLQNLFPPGSTAWKFKSPGTVASCSFSQTTLAGLEWLGGQGHDLLALYVHGVEYTGSDGQTTSGAYMPVLFDSSPDSIVARREELGTPAVFSDVAVDRGDASYAVTAGWRGTVWGTFAWSDLQPAADGAAAGEMTGVAADETILFHRDIREERAQTRRTACGRSPTEPQPKVIQSWTAGKASFVLDARDARTLPTLHHIIDRLAEIPVYEVVAAQVVEGTGVPDVVGMGF